MVPRRGSDGEISMMENSNDDDPCSPVALGITDWSDCASPNAHIFVPTSGSVQSCYLAQDCLHSGTFMSFQLILEYWNMPHDRFLDNFFLGGGFLGYFMEHVLVNVQIS